MDVLVIGAGAIGLTTAISLAEAGLSVTIRTAALPSLIWLALAAVMFQPISGKRWAYSSL